MKKILLIAIIALMAIASGTFAYTFTTATASISVNATASDFATVTAGNVTAPDVFGRFTSIWLPGTLFTVTPDPNYTGDLVVKVFIVNAGALTRYYQHSNMTIQFLDSDNNTADEQGIIQLLNLENAEIEFTWINNTGPPPYKIELTGGSYRLHSWRSMPGGSVQPQIWCEVIQR